jgi:DNA-binding transcriptional LysR family regulator
VDARSLRYFLVVAEELHFGCAAQRLSIAPSGLSRAIRRIEADLRVELFVRHSHDVRLTDAGRALLTPARDAVARLDEALIATRSMGRHELVGVLSVGTDPMLRHRFAPAIFERFAEACPEVVLSRREEHAGPLIEELLARRIDVALAFCAERREGLAYEPIRDAELVVLISSRHPLAQRSWVNLFELRDERFLTPSLAAAPAMRRCLAELFMAAGFHPRYSLRKIEHDEGMAAVREEHGVLLASRFFLESVPAGVTSLELSPPLPLPFELVRRSEHKTPALMRFVEIVHEVAGLDLELSPGPTNSASLAGRKFGEPARVSGRAGRRAGSARESEGERLGRIRLEDREPAGSLGEQGESA